ncbi:MAG: hypothetical protein L3J41_10765 [Melioribacteraceae bacterium]|nr:hypothetical protein [Melioribacteraceae bacterium]
MRFQWIETLSIFILSCVTFLFPWSFLSSENFDEIYSEYNSFKNGGAKYCSTCHTPIGDVLKISNPLWLNKEIPNEFKIYSTDSNTNQHGFPSGETKLCLSCHDGTIAIEDKNVYANFNQLNNNMNFGFSSHTDHPISIIYNSALAFAKGDLADPLYEPSGLGGTIDEDLLENGKLVCSSCHAIHSMMGSGASSGNHFKATGGTFSGALKIPNAKSKLCLTCHKK